MFIIGGIVILKYVILPTLIYDLLCSLFRKKEKHILYRNQLSCSCDGITLPSQEQTSL